MKQNRSHTALLIFAERAKVATRKKLISGKRKNEELHKRLLRHTLAKAKKSGLPYYWISDREQRGENFRQKFYHSIQDIFDLGYEQLIVIGSDTPQISVQTLLDVDSTLAEGSMVVGPSIDGGIYLLGLNRQQFKLLTTLDIPWQTGIEAYFIRSIWERSGLFISILTPLEDLDSSINLITLQSRVSHTSAFAFLFQSLLDQKETFFHYRQIKQVQLQSTYFQLRAPPS